MTADDVLRNLAELSEAQALTVDRHALYVRLADAAKLTDFLASAIDAHARVAGPRVDPASIPPRLVFDLYARTVRELRMVTTDARTRVDSAIAVVAEARAFARRRRRRARKIIALRQRPGRSGGYR